MFLKYLLFVLLFLFCTVPPVSNNPSIIPVIVIESNSRPVWYRDPHFEEIIYPSVSRCISGQMCVFVTMGPWDYTCTLFPDTFWGIIEHDFSPPDTVICYSDTARSLNDTTIFSLKNYLEHKSNAICSGSSVAYTQNSLSYTFSTPETKVRIRNSCLDTVFYSSFSLPRIPLDTFYGVWLESIDTMFCPAYLIDSLSGNLTRQDIKIFNQL